MTGQVPFIPPDFPQYRAAPIASCPRCCNDLINEGIAGFWCPSCRVPIGANEVAYFDEGQVHDD